MQSLLQNGKWIAIASVEQRSIDGRILTKDNVNQILRNFNKEKYKPYIVIGHNKAGGESRVGSIDEIRYNSVDQTLEAKPINLDELFTYTIEAGFYPYLSIELAHILDENNNLSLFLAGVAVLGTEAPAFLGLKTVNFSFKKLDNGDIIMQEKENNNVSLAEKPKETENVKKDKEELSFEMLKQLYAQEQDKNQMMTRAIETYKAEIDTNKLQIGTLKEENNRILFKSFYDKSIDDGILFNADMGFDDITQKDIYKSELYRRWSAESTEGKKNIEWAFTLRKKKVAEQPILGRAEIKMPASESNRDINFRMQELAKKDNTRLSPNNYSYYLEKAMSGD